MLRFVENNSLIAAKVKKRFVAEVVRVSMAHAIEEVWIDRL